MTEEESNIIEFCRNYFGSCARYCLSRMNEGDEAILRDIEVLAGISEQAAHDFRIGVCVMAGARYMLNLPYGKLKDDFPQIYRGVQAKLIEANGSIADTPRFVILANQENAV